MTTFRTGMPVALPPGRWPTDGGSAGTAGDGFRVAEHVHDVRQEHEPGRRPSCRECEREATTR